VLWYGEPLGEEHGTDESVINLDFRGQCQATKLAAPGAVQLSAERYVIRIDGGSDGYQDPLEQRTSSLESDDFDWLIHTDHCSGRALQSADQVGDSVGAQQADISVHQNENFRSGRAEAMHELVPGVGFPGGAQFLNTSRAARCPYS